MKRFFLSIVRIIISWTVGLITVGIAYFLLDIKFLQSLIFGACLYVLTSFIFKRKFSRKTSLDIEKEEAIYRKRELREARLKIYKIGKSRYKIRSVYMWQTITKIYKILMKMAAIAEKEPARFRSIQSFFTTYLDSLIMINDKYTLLASQSVKNQEILLAIKKTEETLENMSTSIEKEMLAILENDILDLDIELNVLKQSLDEAASLKYAKLKGE